MKAILLHMRLNGLGEIHEASGLNVQYTNDDSETTFYIPYIGSPLELLVDTSDWLVLYNQQYKGYVPKYEQEIEVPISRLHDGENGSVVIPDTLCVDLPSSMLDNDNLINLQHPDLKESTAELEGITRKLFTQSKIFHGMDILRLELREFTLNVRFKKERG